MLALRIIQLLAAAASLATASPVPDAVQVRRSHRNDFSCRSDRHPNPVIALHGLFANGDFDLNFLEDWLQPQGFCTFSLTYGQLPLVPFAGLKDLDTSSREITNFIYEVLNKTGAAKVDIVGHSEGALEALYIPKARGIASRVDKVVAIAPPTRGTTLSSIISLGDALHLTVPVTMLLKTLGCAACEDVQTGSAFLKKLNDGPIAQPGNTVTVIGSLHDELVTPPREVTPVLEPGVTNIFIQDYCPLDPVGHISLAIDKNTWYLVRNALEDKTGTKFPCTVSLPIRRDVAIDT